MKHYTIGGKDYYILEQGTDFVNYEVIGTTANLCNAGEDQTLIDQPVPVLQNFPEPYDVGDGQVLYGFSIFNKNDDNPTQIKIKEVWEADNPPDWQYTYYTQAEAGDTGSAAAAELRNLWQTTFSETMETSWSKDLIKNLYFAFISLNGSEGNSMTLGAGQSLTKNIRVAGRFQLMYSANLNDPLNKGPLMFKSRGFAIEAMKQLMGIKGPGRFDYYFRSRINLKGHLVTTKDGINRILIKYNSDDGRRDGSSWINLCGNAFLFVNTGSNSSAQVQPSFQIELGDLTQAGDESYVLQPLFNVASATPPAEFLTWWDRLCDYYESLQNQYEEDAESSYQPVEDYQSGGIRFGMMTLRVDVNGPGALFVGARFAFGTNPNTGGLWLGNLRFEAGVNPRNLASQAWSQMRTRQQNYRPIVQQKTQNRISNAASGSTGTSNLNLTNGQTTSPNSTRPSNTDAVTESNSSGASNGGSDTRNSSNPGPVDQSQ